MEGRDSDRGAVHRAIDGEVAALLGVGGGEARGIPLVGVRALMLAMLEDALRACLGSDRREREDAQVWVEQTRNHWLFSFTTVCETLGLEPTAVRTALCHLRAAEQRVRFGKSRPNSRQANLRIVAPRRRRRHGTAAVAVSPPHGSIAAPIDP